MSEYLVSYADQPDWSRIPSVQLIHTGWLAPCPITATAQLCHNGKDLFVRMQAQESPIRAQLSGPLDQVCNDSCLEFFFAPLSGDKRYFNFECNPLGNLYIGFGAERPTRVRQIVKDLTAFEIQPFTTEGGWGVSYKIPGSFLRTFMPEFDFTGSAACNFYKCGDQTQTPHYLAWAPLTCDAPDYHRRGDFGTLTFAPAE